MDRWLGDLDTITADAKPALRPPPRMKLSEWADTHFYLSAESAAEPGKWKCIPYQVGVMDAMTDPAVEQVWMIKSARVGYTKMFGAAIAYHMHHDPCPVLVVQPTIDDAKGYSKEEIAPMIRDVPCLSALMFEDSEEDNGPKGGGNTILHKKFPGGVLSLAGANSGAGFRRISRRIVALDEIDAYPPSAGSDGDPVKLAMKRAEFYWNRKVIGGSTPLISGHSRIEVLFNEGDQRRYYVPCPHCRHMDYLVFTKRDSGGHWLQFDKAHPEEAHFVCSGCDEAIEHSWKRWMVENGEWRATAPAKFTASGRKIVSFHIWAAYSYSPNATWGHIAAEFLSVKDRPEELRTWVNTTLGETWEEEGEAPDWERLYRRRATYPIGTIPGGVKFLTAGVDVQKDRVVYEVVGWGANKQSWSIDYGVIEMDTADQSEWLKVDDLLTRSYRTAEGTQYQIVKLAVDSGYNTNEVYTWVRRWRGRAIAIKGRKEARVIIDTPSAVDVRMNGQRIARGAKVWPVGVDVVKSELYGWLRLENPAAVGYCSFPEYGEEFFLQLTAEHLMTVVDKRGYRKREWHVKAGRENHVLDARVYARAAASQLGLDRMHVTPPPVQEVSDAPQVTQQVAAPPPPPRKPKPKREGGGWMKSDFRFSGKSAKGWMR